MVLNIEQFTAPGKYAIDLKMEEIKYSLEKGKKINDYQEKVNQTNTIERKYNRTQNK